MGSSSATWRRPEASRSGWVGCSRNGASTSAPGDFERSRPTRRGAISASRGDRANDERAGALGAEAGSVLFDLSGLDARSDPESDWAEVGLLEEDGSVSHPFRGPGAFRSLAVRPPTRWLASVYVRPALLADAQRALGGRIDPVG